MKNKHFSAYLCEYIGYFLLHGRGRVPGATKGRAEAPIDVILGELPEHFLCMGFCWFVVWEWWVILGLANLCTRKRETIGLLSTY